MGIKSKMAFKLSVMAFPSEVYFWTFTWATAQNAEEGSKKWKNFLRGKNQRAQTTGFEACFPEVCGLRVYEMHKPQDPEWPDLTHGLHVHAVIDKRIPRDIVQSIWEREGEGGRIWVKRVPREKAFYLAKYLSKERSEALKGHRLWAPFGQWEHTRVRDVVEDSEWIRTYKMMAATWAGFERLPYRVRCYLVGQVYVFGKPIWEVVKRYISHEERSGFEPEDYE